MSDERRPWWASSTDGADVSTDGADVSTDGADVSTDGADVSTDGADVSTDGARTMNGRRPTTEDPVEAHRAARRGTVPPTAPGEAHGADERDAGGGSARPSGASRTSNASGPSSAEPPHGHADAICGVCPICVLARTLGDTHPELLGHLTEAARHLAAAARAMLDTPGPPDPGTDRVQRIDLD